MTNPTPDLVPGRECGDCMVCCTVPTIDQPAIQKPAGATCRHCEHGCRIHETRPEVCRQYFCAWRRMAIFSEDWRPDRSGVFSELETDVPDYLMASVGISLTLTGNPLKTIRQPGFIDFVVTGIRGGVPLFLALPGPVGYKGAKVCLNTPEMSRAASGARADVKMLLEKALKVLGGYDFKPHVMQYIGHDVSRGPA